MAKQKEFFDEDFRLEKIIKQGDPLWKLDESSSIGRCSVQLSKKPLRKKQSDPEEVGTAPYNMNSFIQLSCRARENDDVDEINKENYPFSKILYLDNCSYLSY